MEKNNEKSNACDSCEFYDYDENIEAYICTINMDQDEMYGFLKNRSKGCSYYKYHNEYDTVKKQI